MPELDAEAPLWCASVMWIKPSQVAMASFELNGEIKLFQAAPIMVFWKHCVWLDNQLCYTLILHFTEIVKFENWCGIKTTIKINMTLL